MRKQLNGLWGWGWPEQRETERKRERTEQNMTSHAGLIAMSIFMTAVIAALVAANQ